MRRWNGSGMRQCTVRATVCGLLVWCLLCLVSGGRAVAQQRFELQREAMVQKALEAEGIRNPRVLEAMR